MRARKIDPAKFIFAGASEVAVEAAANRIAASDIEAVAIDAGMRFHRTCLASFGLQGGQEWMRPRGCWSRWATCALRLK